MIYDGLLLAGVVMVGFFPVYILLQILPETVSAGALGTGIKVIYLGASTFIFYGWFWTHGGQTLGMRAWHLYVIYPTGKYPNWTSAFIRYIGALCSWGLVAGILYLAGVSLWYLSIGLGFSWMLLNPARLAWHDFLSNTRIVHVPPKVTSKN